MAVGDYLSSKAERDFYSTEKEREKWEAKNYPKGEKMEMIDIYMKRGLSKFDASKLVSIISKKKNFFIDQMMIEELKLMDSSKSSPLKNALVTFISFSVFGLIPILIFLIDFIFGSRPGGSSNGPCPGNGSDERKFGHERMDSFEHCQGIRVDGSGGRQGDRCSHRVGSGPTHAIQQFCHLSRYQSRMVAHTRRRKPVFCDRFYCDRRGDDVRSRKVQVATAGASAAYHGRSDQF